MSKIAFLTKAPSFRLISRNVLSNSYRCTDLWNERLNVKLNKNLLANIDNDLYNNVAVSAIDFDILASNLSEYSVVYLDLIKSVIYRHRRSQEALRVYDSTRHAIVRNLCEMDKVDDACELVRDKVNSGVFLDEISVNFLLDALIARQDWEQGSYIAAEWLFQEDSHGYSLGQCLSLRCLAEFYNETLCKPKQLIETDEKVTKTNSNEEIEYKFVKFLPTNCFDDHFDLISCPQHKGRMVGKCLEMIADDLECDESLRTNLRLLGLFLRQNLNGALSLMENLLDEAKTIELCEEFNETIPIIIGNYDRPDSTKSGLDEESLPNYSTFTESEINEGIDQFKDLMSKFTLKSPSLVSQVQTLVSSMEPVLMEKEADLVQAKYHEFNRHRHDIVERTMELEMARRTLQKSKQKLRELTDREELLKYFENMPDVIYQNWLAKRTKEERKFNVKKSFEEDLNNLKRQASKKFVIVHNEEEDDDK